MCPALLCIHARRHVQHLQHSGIVFAESMAYQAEEGDVPEPKGLHPLHVTMFSHVPSIPAALLLG